ncbi:MAG: TlyA family RNA methyltransferase [Anaerolineaceae bacterium]|nr:TlyA family RNA methyltransferase [Anaerolineaceae bacterium]
MANSKKKIRLDVLIADRNLAESRTQAQRLVMAGEVRVNGEMVLKPAVKVDADVEIEVEAKPKFVSRGGHKLEPALLAFGLADLSGVVCADVGSSTGGFTDCMLQYGAEHVFAIDVGYGILHWKLRNDSRVTVMERTNARYVKKLERPVDLVTIDASFISLKILLPVIREWFPSAGGQIVALIKPQFEAGRKDVAKGDGVIRDRDVHRRVLEEILQFVVDSNFSVVDLIQSPIKGPKGNIEFLMHLRYPGDGFGADLDQLVDRLVPEEDEPSIE